MWNDNITLHVIASNPQFLLVNVQDDRNMAYTIAFVYASPTPHLRRKLWNTLAPERFGGLKVWLAVGDFNSISSTEEVSNLESYAFHRNANYNHWIFQEGLIDMGYTRARFTWMRGNRFDSFKGARLDRAIGTSERIDMFPNTSITHMPLFSSDHSPIKVSMEREGECPKRRFLFQATWPLHDNFVKVVSDTWKAVKSVMDNTKHMAEALWDWNINTFGNIHARKRKLLACLGGVQRTSTENWHNGLVKL